MNKGWHGEEVKPGFECKFPNTYICDGKNSGWWRRDWQILLINRGCNELECLNGGCDARSN